MGSRLRRRELHPPPRLLNELAEDTGFFAEDGVSCSDGVGGLTGRCGLCTGSGRAAGAVTVGAGRGDATSGSFDRGVDVRVL